MESMDLCELDTLPKPRQWYGSDLPSAWHLGLEDDRHGEYPEPWYPPRRGVYRSKGWAGFESALALATTIHDSWRLLDMDDNWDNEGSKGYTRPTWERSATFLMKMVEWANLLDRHLPVPMVAPADEGSIDLYWKTPNRRLLINFPAAKDQPATFYGEGESVDTTSGTLGDKTVRPDLVLWLAS